MQAHDRTAPRATAREAPRSGIGRVRPAGWSPGAGTLLGAWIISAAIARLTGATAVILLLAAGFVGVVFEILAGWWRTRSVRVRSIVTPSVATVGEHLHVVVTTDAPDTPRASERRRVTLAHTDGSVISTSAGDDAAIEAHVDRPGVIEELTVRIDVAGPAGLIWWRRSATVSIEPLHLAPRANGPLLEVESVAATSDGSVAARLGHHDGEIDGVRPWRRGDSTNSVHWASSLRTDELIVHDRLTSAEQRWIVDLGSASAEASRLRWTLTRGGGRATTSPCERLMGSSTSCTTRTTPPGGRRSPRRSTPTDPISTPTPDQRRLVDILRRPIRLSSPAIETDDGDLGRRPVDRGRRRRREHGHAGGSPERVGRDPGDGGRGGGTRSGRVAVGRSTIAAGDRC